MHVNTFANIQKDNAMVLFRHAHSYSLCSSIHVRIIGQVIWPSWGIKRNIVGSVNTFRFDMGVMCKPPHTRFLLHFDSMCFIEYIYHKCYLLGHTNCRSVETELNVNPLYYIWPFFNIMINVSTWCVIYETNWQHLLCKIYIPCHKTLFFVKT
jgi:hypothetical protein